MLSQIIEGILTLLVTVALIAFFPVKKQVYKTTKPMKELAKKFCKFDVWAVVVFFVATPLLCVAIGFLLYEVSLARFSFFSEYKILVMQEWWMWAIIPGILLAFALLISLGTVLTQKILGEDYPDYSAYANEKLGYDGMAAASFIGRALLVFSAIYLVFGLNFYTVFKDNEIRWNAFLSLREHTYKYEDIAQLAHVQEFIAPNGDVKSVPFFAIRFNDQEIWQSRWHGFQDDQRNEQLMLFLTQQTGKQIEEVIQLKEED